VDKNLSPDLSHLKKLLNKNGLFYKTQGWFILQLLIKF
jgi:hypothetical protein